MEVPGGDYQTHEPCVEWDTHCVPDINLKKNFFLYKTAKQIFFSNFIVKHRSLSIFNVKLLGFSGIVEGRSKLNMRWLLLLSNSGIIAFYSNGKGDKDLIKINFVKVYTSADTQKTDILKDNIDKSGIYLWENKNNKQFYIGSSINLKRRLNSYYNLKSLAKEPTRYINNAILKEGHSAFILYILEYCSKEILLQREQHYFYLLKPSYNICPIAGSTLGLLHNEETKNKISIKKLVPSPPP